MMNARNMTENDSQRLVKSAGIHWEGIKNYRLFLHSIRRLIDPYCVQSAVFVMELQRLGSGWGEVSNFIG